MSEQMKQLLEYLSEGVKSGIESPLASEILHQIVLKNIIEHIGWLVFFGILLWASLHGFRLLWGKREKFWDHGAELEFYGLASGVLFFAVIGLLGTICNITNVLLWLVTPKAELLYVLLSLLGKK